MSSFVNIARPVALYLLIVVSGFYAGLHFTSMMNPSVFGIVNPSGDLMPSVQWAASWQITDGFMGSRMGVFGPIIQLTYILTILMFMAQWRKPTLWLVLVAFIFFSIDVHFTIQNQLPINQYIQTLNFTRLTDDQIQKIETLHPQLIANFQKRELLAIGSFIVVALTPFLPSATRWLPLHNPVKSLRGETGRF
ncbi:hypothetical protein [Spirosoma arcticum]